MTTATQLRFQLHDGVANRWVLLLLPAVLFGSSCSRARYRLAADRQSYAILDEKTDDPAWAVPRSSIEPDPRSRFYDPCEPDNPPLPPDDPAAHRYLDRVDGMRGAKKWQRLGRLDTVENPLWPTYLGGQQLTKSFHELPKIDNLSLQHAVELGLIHSREYQEQLENVYLAALALTGQRYRFNVRPIGLFGEPGADLFYQHQPDDRSQWQLESARFGLSKLLPTGTQLVAELVNNTIWVFSGPHHSSTASTAAYTLVQPLLRGAGRAIVLESLTQAERGVLYTVRDFARFRKDYYVMVATGQRAIPLPSSSSRGRQRFPRRCRGDHAARPAPTKKRLPRVTDLLPACPSQLHGRRGPSQVGCSRPLAWCPRTRQSLRDQAARAARCCSRTRASNRGG